MATSDFRPEVEIRQFRTCELKNDSVGHNGLSYGQTPGFTERISMVYSCVGNQQPHRHVSVQHQTDPEFVCMFHSPALYNSILYTNFKRFFSFIRALD